jgi:hypothetical protein
MNCIICTQSITEDKYNELCARCFLEQTGDEVDSHFGLGWDLMIIYGEKPKMIETENPYKDCKRCGKRYLKSPDYFYVVEGKYLRNICKNCYITG